MRSQGITLADYRRSRSHHCRNWHQRLPLPLSQEELPVFVLSLVALPVLAPILVGLGKALLSGRSGSSLGEGLAMGLALMPAVLFGLVLYVVASFGTSAARGLIQRRNTG